MDAQPNSDDSPYSPPDEPSHSAATEVSSAASIGAAVFVVLSTVAALAYNREIRPEEPMNIFHRRPWNYLSAALMAISVVLLIVAFFRAEKYAGRAARFAVIAAFLIAIFCRG